ncbi:hypothetical protein AAV35_14215 [Salimicrobium jeotgali]|uniref:Uncharacterized protein n=2 Tax=Salimicrobium jeotgali TaxID=1230341 RepID=A0AAC9J4U3_9BACI|nr:hypothetical protein [Salimicrobium jeotgali]APC65610.1 hypothetical protein AAV35_14215 [Salimicrobium jeotgali]MBM7696671.1 type I restriction-modification system DNA methylase subunit [Salimicrobium jeotgali]
MLGLMFYKFLSDKTLETFVNTSGAKGTEAEVVQAYEEAYESYGDSLIKMIQNVLGYYVLPQHLYQTWLKDIREGTFELEFFHMGCYSVVVLKVKFVNVY